MVAGVGTRIYRPGKNKIMANKIRPEQCTDEMLEYLDDLRESGDTNMFGAGRYLEAEFPELAGGGSFHSSDAAREILGYWMDTFGQDTR